MEPLTWTGSLSGLNIIFTAVLVLLALGIVAQILISFVPQTDARAVAGDGTMASNQGASGFINMIVNYLFYALVGITLIYLVLGVVMGTGAGILGGMARQFLPVWTALIVTFVVSITFKRKLGLYGKLFDSTVGMIGFAIVMFWVFTGVFGGVFDLLVTHDSLSQVSGMKNKLPGTPLRGAEEGDYQWFLLGGDNLARDVFSRLIKGSWVVVKIAPFATLFAFMVGITLGLPAGYYGGRLDTILSFLANLILAFPVILLFYLLVTPEIVLTGIPNYMALFLFIFPLVFLAILLNSRFYTQPSFRTPLLIVVLGVGAWALSVDGVQRWHDCRDADLFDPRHSGGIGSV